MQLKFLPSFVKRKGRITKKQTQSLTSLSEFSVKTIQEVEDISKQFDKCYLEIGFGNAIKISSLVCQKKRSNHKKSRLKA